MSEKLCPPIHPGEVLMQDFIEGFGITQNKLAVSIGVPPRRINEIVPRQARDHGGHRAPAGPLFRGFAAVLAQSADAV